MLRDNRTSKYLLYALGEIILVVIGILIALQINNWNTERLTKLEERSLLENLKEEYLENLSTLNIAIKKRQDQMHALNILNDIVFDHNPNTEVQLKIDSIIGVSRYIPTFESRTGVVQEIINSGKLNIIQNKRLRKLLSNLSGELDDLRKREDGTSDIILNNYNTYLMNNYSLKLSDYYIAKSLWKEDSIIKSNWVGKETLNKVDVNIILKDPKFESILSLVNLWSISSQKASLEILSKINQTIQIIDKELSPEL